MSYTMNGKPMWCRPARTRGGEGVRDIDTDEVATEQLGILAEAAQLVAAGIRAGLVYRPTAVDDPTGKLRMDRPNNVWSRCDTCHQQFQHGKKSKLTTCFSCRLPAATCKGCGKQFQPQRRSQLLCGKACVGLALTAAATERNKDRATVPCVICGAKHLIRFAGGKMAVTCGRQCAQQHVAQINRDKKQQRQTK
jgi:hypothetical protein